MPPKPRADTPPVPVNPGVVTGPGDVSLTKPALLRASRSTLLCFAAYLLLAAVGTVAIAAAHLGNGPAWGLAYAFMMAIVLGILLFRPLPGIAERLLRNPILWAAMLLVMATADQIHFHHAQTKSNPLTSALALELPARAFLHGHDPYSIHLPGNAPISPGPGWILLVLPLTAPGLTGLLGAAALAVTYATLRRWDPAKAGLYCLLMLVQPLFQSQAANGQDLYVLSLCLVTFALLLGRHAGRTPAIALIGVLAGVLATARMPMLLLLLIPTLGLIRHNRRTGWVLLISTVCTTVILDAGFAVWAHRSGHWFQPMHVFRRGAYQAGHGSQIAVVLLSLGAAAWILFRMHGTVRSWIFGMWLLMSALFIPEAIKELVFLHYDWRWEGSNYITFPLPLLVAVLVLQRRTGMEPSLS